MNKTFLSCFVLYWRIIYYTLRKFGVKTRLEWIFKRDYTTYLLRSVPWFLHRQLSCLAKRSLSVSFSIRGMITDWCVTASQILLHNGMLCSNNGKCFAACIISWPILWNEVRWEIQDSGDRASAGLFPLSFFIPSIAYVSTKKNVFPEIVCCLIIPF